MKKSKILVPAVALLALGVAASATGTVAWFNSNTVVSGSGMNVNCIVAKNLVISNASTGTYGPSAVSVYNTAATLNPSSTSLDGLKAGSFFKADAANIEYATGAAKVGSVITAATVATTGDNVDVAKHSFWIKNEGQEGTTIDHVKLSEVTIDGEHLAISNSVRVGFVVGTNAYLFRIAGGDASYYGLKAVGTVTVITDNVLMAGATALSEVTTAAVEGTQTDKEIVAALGTTATEVKVYVWYEGQDSNCKSANAIAAENLSISFKVSY